MNYKQIFVILCNLISKSFWNLLNYSRQCCIGFLPAMLSGNLNMVQVSEKSNFTCKSFVFINMMPKSCRCPKT